MPDLTPARLWCGLLALITTAETWLPELTGHHMPEELLGTLTAVLALVAGEVITKTTDSTPSVLPPQNEDTP